MTGIVTPSNLGSDFDIGGQVASKINIVPATSTSAGKVRFATSSEVATATPGLAIDPAQAKSLFASAALGALLSALPTTLPATAGQAWLNGGVLSVS